jgi:hypothetical protein
VISSGESASTSDALLHSLIIYIIFWFSTRMSIEYFIVFIVLAAALYIIHLYQKESGFQTSKRLQIATNIMHVSMLVVLVMGFFFYMIEKKIEYKKNFSFTTFIVGKPKCRNKSPKTTRMDIFNFLARKSVSPKK